MFARHEENEKPLVTPETPQDIFKRMAANVKLGEEMNISAFLDGVFELDQMGATKVSELRDYLQNLGKSKIIWEGVLDDLVTNDQQGMAAGVQNNLRATSLLGMDQNDDIKPYIDSLRRKYPEPEQPAPTIPTEIEPEPLDPELVEQARNLLASSEGYLSLSYLAHNLYIDYGVILRIFEQLRGKEAVERLTPEEAYSHIVIFSRYDVNIPEELLFQFSDSLKLGRDQNLRTVWELDEITKSLGRKTVSKNTISNWLKEDNTNAEQKQRAERLFNNLSPDLKQKQELVEESHWIRSTQSTQFDQQADKEAGITEDDQKTSSAQGQKRFELTNYAYNILLNKLKRNEAVPLDEFKNAFLEYTRAKIENLSFDIDHIKTKRAAFWQKRAGEAGLIIKNNRLEELPTSSEPNTP